MSGSICTTSRHGISSGPGQPFEAVHDLSRTMMLPALKVSLDGFELRDHSLLCRNPPDDESSVDAALPTEVGETQECEGLWFSLSTLLPVTRGEPPEFPVSSET